jgi:hypothetical protein
MKRMDDNKGGVWMPVDTWDYMVRLCGWDEPTKIAGITRSDLRARREKMGLSQRQLAGLLALSERQVVENESERESFMLAFGQLSQVMRLAIKSLRLRRKWTTRMESVRAALHVA